jgi:predicted DNA-binding antitoxin AbrB/MazE fold protein
MMTITVDATYENGTLKLAQPLPLKNHEKVRVTVEQEIAESPPSGPATMGNTKSLAEETAGMMGWTGDAETLDRILKEAEETFYL